LAPGVLPAGLGPDLGRLPGGRLRRRVSGPPAGPRPEPRYDRTYAARRRAGGDPALEYVRGASRGEVGPNDSLYAWARSEIGASAEGALKPIDLLEGTSKMFRTLCLLALISVPVLAIAGEWALAGAGQPRPVSLIRHSIGKHLRSIRSRPLGRTELDYGFRVTCLRGVSGCSSGITVHSGLASFNPDES
jgi:hypothetical protein